jgi:hypothetical protein
LYKKKHPHEGYKLVSTFLQGSISLTIVRGYILTRLSAFNAQRYASKMQFAVGAFQGPSVGGKFANPAQRTKEPNNNSSFPLESL